MLGIIEEAEIDAPVHHSHEHCAFCAILAMRLISIGQTVNPADQFLETGQLSDPNLEARAVALGRTLRCVVCANQSIEDSEVETAQTLRRFVRERLGSGVSENNIRAELIRNCSQFVGYETGQIWIWLAALRESTCCIDDQRRGLSSCGPTGGVLMYSADYKLLSLTLLVAAYLVRVFGGGVSAHVGTRWASSWPTASGDWAAACDNGSVCVGWAPWF